jgi:aerobic carbon-monoxide dehydrogenase medium subunit
VRDFEFVAARTLDDAIGALGRANGSGRVLAGGTDLITQIKEGRRSPADEHWRVPPEHSQA